MQPLTNFDYEKFKNTSKWEVIHDGDSQLFYIANANGNRLQGMYTTRRLAGKRLFDYLESLQDNIKVQGKKKPEPKQEYDLFGLPQLDDFGNTPVAAPEIEDSTSDYLKANVPNYGQLKEATKP